MFQITGEARFADLVEHTLLNSVLAGQSIDGTKFFYTNTLRQLNPMPVDLRWPRSRVEYMSCYCCPPNVARTIARSTEYAYAMSDRGVYVVLYGGSRLDTTLADGSRFALRQESDYPWAGKIKLTIESAPPGELSLMLRIPSWASGASVNVARRAERVQSGTFHEVRRKWSAGDVVTLDLPMPVRVIEANPYVEEARNQIAVMRGPVVYCLESIDLPADVRLLDVRIPRDAKLVARKADDLLGGVVVIEGTAIAQSSGDWSGQLYREFSSSSVEREIPLKLIPYYAWDNRGSSEMSVWLPLAR